MQTKELINNSFLEINYSTFIQNSSSPFNVILMYIYIESEKYFSKYFEEQLTIIIVNKYFKYSVINMFQKFIYHLILIKYFLLTPVSKKKSLFPLSWEKKNYLKNPIQKKILKIPLIYLNLPQNPFNFHFRYVLDPPSPPSLPS